MPFTLQPTSSAGTASNSIIVQDEGSTIGTATVVNIVGSGGTASFSNGTATITISGGTAAMTGAQAWAPSIGFAMDATVTGANLGINGGSFAAQLFIGATMAVRSLQYRNTDTGTARSMEWGLYYDNGGTASPRVADGTDSFTPGGAASNRTSAATGAPVTVQPGLYWLVMRNTGGATNFQVGIISSGDSAAGIIGIQTKTIGSSLGSTLDLSTGWTRSSNNILVAYIRGSVFGESSAF